jgi:hypothetical protein
MNSFNLQDRVSGLYRYDAKSTDVDEFYDRVNNYLNCTEAFFNLNYSSELLKRMVQKFDINRYCMGELKELKEFANNTDLKYENVYAYMSKESKAAVLNRIYKA